jgi:uncharacterized protein YndB with AHSA1/START domain
MESKTQIHAEPGKQDLNIIRTFDLPVELLFRAYAEPELVAQWMGTKVIKLESQTHGSYRFKTSDPQGNVAFRAKGVIHEFSPNRKIIRTFEMENAPFGVQLELIEFEALSEDTSRLRIHTIYESQDQRDQLMRLPFAFGLNMAHDRLQDIVQKLK